MANIFKQLKSELGILKANLRFSREPSKRKLIREKIKSLEEVFDFAKEYTLTVNHQSSSDVGERLFYYLTEGELNYRKVAEYFNILPGTVASNIHYASRAYSVLLGGIESRLVEAEDLETLRVAHAEFQNIKKSVSGHFELPKSILKRSQKSVAFPLLSYDNRSPSIVIPEK